MQDRVQVYKSSKEEREGNRDKDGVWSCLQFLTSYKLTSLIASLRVLYMCMCTFEAGNDDDFVEIEVKLISSVLLVLQHWWDYKSVWIVL